MQNVFQWLDVVMVPFWFTIFLAIGLLYRNRYLEGQAIYPYFVPAIALKMFCGIAVGLVYQFYYTSGDTIYYYQIANRIYETSLSYPQHIVDLFLFDGILRPELLYEPFAIDAFAGFRLSADTATYFVAKLFTVPVAMSLGSYFGAAVIVGGVSFFCIYRLYTTLVVLFPRLAKQFVFAVFFIPSVMFWGSGLLKDSITFSMLSLLLYFLHKTMIKKQGVLIGVIAMLVIVYTIFSIKPYIALSFVPLSLSWVVFQYQTKIKNELVRLVALPMIMLVSMGIGWVVLNSLSSGAGKYDLSNLLEFAVAANNDLSADYYYTSETGGSRYFIGEFDDSFGSIISFFPAAVWTTFFRPNPWEVNSVIMFFTFIESYLLLGLFLRTLWRVGPYRFVASILQSPFLLYIVSFSISFAFFVGLTSGNYGNLVRYKIPCLPFFVASLFIIEYMTKKKNPAA